MSTREEFEAFMSVECPFMSLQRDWEGYYNEVTIHIAWRAWCKALGLDGIKES